VGHYRPVASDVLKELQDDQKLPEGIHSKLKGIMKEPSSTVPGMGQLFK